MDCEEIKDAAKIARSKIEGLLSYLRPDSNNESANIVEALQNSMRSVDSDQIYDTVQRVLLNEEEADANHVPQLEIPFSVINALNSHDKFATLLQAEEVKALLGTGKFEVGVSLFSNEGKVCEPPHGDYCDVDDEIFYNVQAMQQLKQTDPKAWEAKWGQLQYSRLSQQILQAILSCDLSLTVEAAKEMTARALCMAVSWFHADIPKLQSLNTIQKVFDGYGCDLKQRSEIKPIIQIEIGSTFWDDDSYGIGMILNSTITIELHQESAAPDSERNSGCVLILNCLIRTAVPFGSEIALSESNVYCDCRAIGTGEPQFQTEGGLLFDCSQTTLLLSFYKPSFSGPYELPRKHSSRQNKKYECRKTMKETISEFVGETPTELPMSTELRYCGDIFNYLPNHSRNKSKRDEPCISAEIIFDSFSAREVIRSVECSSCHILALTNLGIVYSCGDGSHGQLGHGSLDFCRHLRPVTCFIEGSKNSEITRIIQISAGSGRVGSHSAAVDAEGNLYSWGKTIICGHFPEMRHDAHFESLTLTPKKVKALEKYHAVKVSCGNDHVIVLIRDQGTPEGEDIPTNSFANSSKVFSWGIMASGRLGHDRPRNVTESGSKKRKARAKTSERYESKPTVISALDNEQITDIAAGKHHSLAISKDGRVFAWGSNSFGQCGVAQNDTHHSELVRVRGNNTDSNEDKTPGILEDVWLPRHLSEFGPMTGKRIISISAGGIHSAAIDSDGKLYSWGGGGDNYCLGHGDSFTYRNGFDLPSESRRRKLLAMAGCLEVPSWGSPREIKCLRGERIRYVDLGEYDGAAISESGRMYVWGDKWFKLKLKSVEEQDSFVGSVESPSTPMAFDEELVQSSQKYVHDIACGMGTTFIISSDNHYGNILGRRLYHECLSIRRTHDAYDYETLVDCILTCVDGKLCCHRVVVAHRSPVLDQMLAIKARPQDASKYIELIIPGIRHQIMRQVLCFMYTDAIPDFHLLSFDTLVELWEASHTLMIEQLMRKCKDILKIDHNYSISPETDFVSPPINADDINKSSFCTDMNIALQEGRFSDVCIIAEEKTILAHQCILSAASEYFGKVLNNAREKKRGAKIILELPGSFSSVMRLLGFLYTGHLPSSNHEHDLIMDLENAHRYKLVELKSLCDSRIHVTDANACDMLLLAHQVQSPRLRIRSMHMIVKTLSKQFHDGSRMKRFESMISQCPMGTKDELFELIKEKNGLGCILPPDRKLLAADLHKRYLLQKSRLETQMTNELTGKNAKGLSTKSTIILLILAIGYGYLQQFIPMTGLVPIINCIVLVATCIHFFRRLV